jgi:hypothetical protein
MNNESHLNSEQLDNLLSRSPDAKWQKHVDGCPTCAAQLASLRVVLGDFRQAATASAKHHRYLAPAASRRKVPGPAWGIAFAALLISVGAPLAVHYGSARPQVEIAADAPQPVTVQQPTLSDDALLSGVQNDLSASVPRSMLPLSGTSTNTNSDPRKN